MSKKNNTDKGTNNVRTTVGLSLSEMEMTKLKSISFKKERSVSWLVSKAVSNYLETIDLTKL